MPSSRVGRRSDGGALVSGLSDCPAIDSVPYLDDFVTTIGDVVLLVHGCGHADMAGQDAQPAAHRKAIKGKGLDRVEAARLGDDAVLLVHGQNRQPVEGAGPVGAQIAP